METVKMKLRRTGRHVHLTQYDGLQIDRTIYVDYLDREFIKINGFAFSLWHDIAEGKIWNIDFIW